MRIAPKQTLPVGAIHSTKISGNFGPKLNGSVRSNRKSFEKTGPPFEVVLFSRSDRLEFWLNGSRPVNGKFVTRVPQDIRGPRLPNHMGMFWGTRATDFSIYTTKKEGAVRQILGTGAKFKRVLCQKIVK